MRLHRFAVLGFRALAALSTLTLLPVPAWGETEIGVFKGLYEPEGEDTVDVWGVSGEYRLNRNLGFGASLSSIDLPDQVSSCPRGTFCIADEAIALVVTPVEVDAYALDLSASWRPRGGDAVLFAGPGVAMYDYTAQGGFEPPGFESREEIFTFHAGVGYEWNTGGRFSVRPELRGRHYFAESVERGFILEQSSSTDLQLSVSLGWRFGD